MHRHTHKELVHWQTARLKYLIFLSIYAALVGCKPNACKDIDCHNGECIDGSCICANAYEGIECLTESREKFIGPLWDGNETCQGGTQYLPTRIAATGNEPGNLSIYNFHTVGDTVSATVNQDSIWLPPQIYGVDYLEGSGFFSQGTIAIEYVLWTTGGQTTHCVTVLTR
jgi:hypothetical protein